WIPILTSFVVHVPLPVDQQPPAVAIERPWFGFAATMRTYARISSHVFFAEGTLTTRLVKFSERHAGPGWEERKDDDPNPTEEESVEETCPPFWFSHRMRDEDRDDPENDAADYEIHERPREASCRIRKPSITYLFVPRGGTAGRR